MDYTKNKDAPLTPNYQTGPPFKSGASADTYGATGKKNEQFKPMNEQMPLSTDRSEQMYQKQQKNDGMKANKEEDGWKQDREFNEGRSMEEKLSWNDNNKEKHKMGQNEKFDMSNNKGTSLHEMDNADNKSDFKKDGYLNQDRNSNEKMNINSSKNVDQKFNSGLNKSQTEDRFSTNQDRKTSLNQDEKERSNFKNDDVFNQSRNPSDASKNIDQFSNLSSDFNANKDKNASEKMNLNQSDRKNFQDDGYLNKKGNKNDKMDINSTKNLNEKSNNFSADKNADRKSQSLNQGNKTNSDDSRWVNNDFNEKQNVKEDNTKKNPPFGTGSTYNPEKKGPFGETGAENKNRF